MTLLCASDFYHEPAKKALHAYQGLDLRESFLTTNNVILETLTVARREGGNSLAVEAGELLLFGKMVTVCRTTADDELAAFQYLEAAC